MNMRKCVDCNKVTTRTKFYGAKRCLECNLIYKDKNRKYPKGPPRVNGKRDRLAYNEYMRKFCALAIPKMRQSCFELLNSQKCVLCGYLDIRALCFDHINGGGTQDRKKLKGGSLSYLRDILRNPKKYRVLCWNCNWVAHLERKNK